MMVPAGVITTDTNNVYLRVNGLFDSPQAVRDMPIRINNQTLRLGDMADVTMTYQAVSYTHLDVYKRQRYKNRLVKANSSEQHSRPVIAISLCSIGQ